MTSMMRGKSVVRALGAASGTRWFSANARSARIAHETSMAARRNRRFAQFVALGGTGVGFCGIALSEQLETPQIAAVPEAKLISDDALQLVEELREEGASKENLDLVLYQYQPCPFCNKVRAYLDFHKIPYETVEVDPMRKTELKWSEYKKVPVITVKGKQLNDSTEIIATLSSLLEGRKSDQDFSVDEKKWIFWLDDYFVHLLPPNIYRTATESIQTFDYLTTEGNFSWYARESARYFGAAAMYLVAKKLKKKYGVGEPREDIYNALNTWTEAVDEKGDFLGGSHPNLADVAVFGVIRSLTNFDTFDDIMANSNIKPWYERMQVAVGEPSKVN